MTGQKTVAILTGGGDTRSLNPTIAGCHYKARKHGLKVYGIFHGFGGLMGNTSDINDLSGVEIVDLTHADLNGIELTGGSFLYSSRINPGSLEKVEKCLSVIEKYGIDYLIAIGGDNTNEGAKAIYQAGGIINTIIKTMDNDVYGTDVCLGYPSAVWYATDFAGGYHSTLKTNSRDAVFNSFGREAGWAPLASASWLDPKDPDRYPHKVIPPEAGEVTKEEILRVYDEAKKRHRYVEFVISEGVKLRDINEEKDELVKKYGRHILDDYENINYKVLDLPYVVAEWIRDHIGLKGKAKRESQVLYRRMDYILRSGPPTEIDRELAFAAGKHVIDLFADDITGRMVNIRKGNLIAGYDVGDVSLEEVSGGRTLEEGMFDRETWGPTQMFIDYVRPFAPDPRNYRLFDGELPKVQPVV